MHKFIIVGHPQSGYQEVENLLHECGMGKANPSRREGLLPAQISEMLRQAHGTPALAALTAPEQIEQIGTAPIWHGMAMDLMLGNLDQRFWGWSDPGAIHLLEYWKQLDPSINFVFVYADPQSALVGPGADDALSVDAKLSNWQAFNAAMLHFYNRNPKRSVLVHAEQVRHSVRVYLQQLRTQLNAPLNEPPAHVLLGTDEADTQPAVSELEASVGGAPAVSELVAEQEPVAGRLHGAGVEDSGNASVLSRFVAGHCVAQNPPVVQLYDELQAVANLPFEFGMLAAPADAAWVALQMNTRWAARQRVALREQEAQLVTVQQQADDRRLALQRVGEEVERKQKALDTSENRIAELGAELERLRVELAGHAETSEENELLLSQLHEVQEELERQFVAKEHHEQALTTSAKALESLQMQLASVQREADERRAALEKAGREVLEKQQALAATEGRTKELNAELERLRVELAGHAETSEENELLLSQLHEVQEELERLFFAKQSHEKALAETSRALDVAKANEHKLQEKLDASAKTAAASTKRVSELSKEVGELRKKLAQQAEAAKEKERLLGKLREAQEALKALRMKSAEQARLKKEKEKEQLLVGLRNVQEAGAPKNMAPKPLPAVKARKQARLLGAAERIQQQLTYRLGATMIQNSRSLGGWIGMPFALIGTTRKHRAEVRARGDATRPPVFRYDDRQEAERVKKQLSYRLGAAFLRNVKSPIGWIRLPFALRREVKAFRMERLNGRRNA
ncbi:MAG: hypothetical protein ABTQ28_14170 [Thauera sp.]